MDLKYKRMIEKLTNMGYILGCLVLFLISFWIIFYAMYTAIVDAYQGTYSISEQLDDVGLLVFSIAVLDVAKYLLIEEVFKKKKKDDHPEEFKQSLMRFMSIVITALFLKGLVLAIQVSKTDVSMLLYPIALLLTPVLLIMGLGVYQYLHAKSLSVNPSTSRKKIQRK